MNSTIRQESLDQLQKSLADLKKIVQEMPEAKIVKLVNENAELVTLLRKAMNLLQAAECGTSLPQTHRDAVQALLKEVAPYDRRLRETPKV